MDTNPPPPNAVDPREDAPIGTIAVPLVSCAACVFYGTDCHRNLRYCRAGDRKDGRNVHFAMDPLLRSTLVELLRRAPAPPIPRSNLIGYHLDRLAEIVQNADHLVGEQAP